MSAFLGRSMATINGMLRDEFGLVVTDDHLDSMRAAIYERFRSDLKPIPGIREALARIDAQRCVASSSQLERIRLSLELTGLRDLFEPHIFSASMVARGKPAPDLFLHVAREMGVAPEHCTVIEDSPAGIAAAKACRHARLCLRRRLACRARRPAGGLRDACSPTWSSTTCATCPTCWRRRARAATSSRENCSAPSMSAPAAHAPGFSMPGAICSAAPTTRSS